MRLCGDPRCVSSLLFRTIWKTHPKRECPDSTSNAKQLLRDQSASISATPFGYNHVDCPSLMRCCKFLALHRCTKPRDHVHSSSFAAILSDFSRIALAYLPLWLLFWQSNMSADDVSYAVCNTLCFLHHWLSVQVVLSDCFFWFVKLFKGICSLLLSSSSLLYLWLVVLVFCHRASSYLLLMLVLAIICHCPSVSFYFPLFLLHQHQHHPPQPATPPGPR